MSLCNSTVKFVQWPPRQDGSSLISGRPGSVSRPPPAFFVCACTKPTTSDRMDTPYGPYADTFTGNRVGGLAKCPPEAPENVTFYHPT